MKGHDLDTYVARFTHLCTKAQVDKDTMAIRSQFARGLHPELRKDILRFERPNLNTTFDEWVTKARNQQKQDAFNAGLLYPGQSWIKWQTPTHQSRSHHHGHSRGHTNGTPMDVDVEPVTRVYKAYTEIDKKKHRAEGRCFECSRQGHMARECPTKKKQPPRPSGKENRQYSGYKERFHPYQKKSSGKPNFQKSNHFQSRQSHVRATIEEEEPDIQQVLFDNTVTNSDDLNVNTIAARTARFLDEEKREWIAKMQEHGTNFQ